MVAWSTHEDPARPMRGRVHTDGTDTEYEAAASGKVPRGQQRRQVLERFQAVAEHGSTDYEMGVALGAFRHACGTRREELIRDGHPIVDSGHRRKTDTGRKAIVWTLRPSPQSRGILSHGKHVLHDHTHAGRGDDRNEFASQGSPSVTGVDRTGSADLELPPPADPVQLSLVAEPAKPEWA